MRRTADMTEAGARAARPSRASLAHADQLRDSLGGQHHIVIFFFQAEDGIRDLTVTGVQTCALPIYPRARREKRDVCDHGPHRGGRPRGLANIQSHSRPSRPLSLTKTVSAQLTTEIRDRKSVV